MLDRDRLESLNVNGLDVVLLLTHIAIETVGATAPHGSADQRLTDIANRLDDCARQSTEPRMKFLLGQLAAALIATE
jgi:hypothetical protein